MRNKDRIGPILDRLGKCWKKVPDWRLGQVISNIFGTHDLFHLEDENFIEIVEKWFKMNDL